MKISFIALGLVPAFALGACGGSDNTTATNVTAMESPAPMDNIDPGNAMVSGQPASPGQAFADTAGASDMYEIQAGKLAQERAGSQALKDFGAMMVKGHTDSTAKLKAAAAKANPAITPNPVLNAAQEADLAALRSATGSGFDTAFKTQQVAAHQKALGAMQDYAANGDVAELKAFASSTSKVVRMHLDKIKGM